MTVREFDLEVTLEICIAEISNGQCSLKLRLMRKKAEGFREDAQNAIFGGIVLKEHEYLRLVPNSIIQYQGIKAPVRIEVPDEEGEKVEAITE